MISLLEFRGAHQNLVARGEIEKPWQYANADQRTPGLVILLFHVDDAEMSPFPFLLLPLELRNRVYK